MSFAHGSNDGQKGMGLIMLILVGTVPTAYALNHAVGVNQVQTFSAVSEQVIRAVGSYVDPNTTVADSGPELEDFVSTHKFNSHTMLALQEMVGDIRNEATQYGSLGAVSCEHAGQRSQPDVSHQRDATPDAKVRAEGQRCGPEDVQELQGLLDGATKFIPPWVKVAVALALGLGTMIGWKRIVVTVGEKIGKTHLTYAQGLSAELVAMLTILAADNYGLPVSTTHVLSSGVAGTMAANKSGLQMSTLRDIALAWVFTLPVAALLSGLSLLALQRNRKVAAAKTSCRTACHLGGPFCI